MTNISDMAKPRPLIIAVVEDDASARRAVARLLSVCGYHVETFASAEDFLVAATTSEATCLIVDIGLGGISGLDLARRLSASGFEFPVIFVTGSDDDTLRAQCRDVGCAAFLRKPLVDDRLLAALAKTVGSPAACA